MIVPREEASRLPQSTSLQQKKPTPLSVPAGSNRAGLRSSRVRLLGRNLAERLCRMRGVVVRAWVRRLWLSLHRERIQ